MGRVFLFLSLFGAVGFQGWGWIAGAAQIRSGAEANCPEFGTSSEIRRDTRLTATQAAQIRKFLNRSDEGISVGELIDSTDDQELRTGTFVFADGKVLEYYGAEVNGRPSKIFFIKGTTTPAAGPLAENACAPTE